MILRRWRARCDPLFKRYGGVRVSWHGWHASVLTAKRSIDKNGPMRITAKADYGLRALLEIAAADGAPVKSQQIADAQQIPSKLFLENTMRELARARLINAERGPQAATD